MAREDVPSLAALARTSHIRRDTMYGWFREAEAHLSTQSVDKLVATLGAEPGDPWYDEPTERHLDPETLALLDAAVERAFERLGDRLVGFLDERLRDSARPDAP
jgi:hypothetical protein